MDPSSGMRGLRLRQESYDLDSDLLNPLLRQFDRFATSGRFTFVLCSLALPQDVIPSPVCSRSARADFVSTWVTQVGQLHLP